MTYIERHPYYYCNRVFIVSRRTPQYVMGSILNLETWQRSAARIKRRGFYRRFEVSPLQFR